MVTIQDKFRDKNGTIEQICEADSIQITIVSNSILIHI